MAEILPVQMKKEFVMPVKTGIQVRFRFKFRKPLIGVGKSFRSPRPPNRACGSPAHGSPVGGFLIGIGSLTHGSQ